MHARIALASIVFALGAWASTPAQAADSVPGQVTVQDLEVNQQPELGKPIFFPKPVTDTLLILSSEYGSERPLLTDTSRHRHTAQCFVKVFAASMGSAWVLVALCRRFQENCEY